ncbi:hypothetical protein MTO96_035037, partial [Rhipicephalus appendiculatus]
LSGRRSYKLLRKGGKKRDKQSTTSETESSQSLQPQQQPTGTGGAQQAASGTTLMTSPSASSDKASPQPPGHQAAPAEEPNVSTRADDEQRLVVHEPSHSPQPTTATGDGLLEYWPLIAAIAVFVIVILLLLLFAAPLRPKTAPRARSAAVRACESEECRHYAQLFSGSMNASAPACVNFYAHVCGRWDASQSGKDKVSVLADSWRRLSRRAGWRLSMATVLKGHPEPVHRASHFLHTCLDVIKAPKVPEIREVLERGNITWPRRNERPDFLGALFYMARRVFVPVAFDVAVLKVDQRSPSPSKARTLFFGPPMRFLGHARALARLQQSGKLLDHLRLTYEVLAYTVNETRLKELEGHFQFLGDFLRRYERASSTVTRSGNASFFLQYTPSVPKARWDTLTKRYLNVSLIGDEDTLKGGVAIQSTGVFSAVFELHAKQGEHVTDDIVEGLCVQALVDYVSSDLLRSLLGGSRELATESIYERCFSDAYRFYGVAINAYFHQPLSHVVADLSRVATLVQEIFTSGLRDNDTTLRAVAPGLATRGSSGPSSRRGNFDLALTGLSMLDTKSFTESYGDYPPQASSSLHNWMQHAAFASGGGKTPAGASLWESLNEDVGRTAGRFHNFRLGLAHMEEPFYAANVSPPALMAGVGARLAAALFYDHVAARSPDDLVKAYAQNQECLFPGTGGGSPDLEIQGAVASVDVALTALKAASVANTSSGTSVGLWDTIFGFLADDELFFSFFCYLHCGEPDGERLCNVPLRHSAGFSRVFGCRSGSAMNPEKKCRMSE